MAESAAPRIGYLLTAARAGRRYDEASSMWKQLDELSQAEVITELGVQARIAVEEAGIPSFGVDFTTLADTICAEALTAAQRAYEGTRPWQPPECAHCRELVASALAEVQVRAGVVAGMPPPYVDLICRGEAVQNPVRTSR
jgi:hypothetical protein